MNNLFMGQVFALRFDVRSNRVNDQFAFVIVQEKGKFKNVFLQKKAQPIVVLRFFLLL